MYTKNLNNLTFGIKYSKSFRILDVSGKISDTFLYNSNSPFNTKLFPLVSEGTMREKILRNSETNNYVKIDASDIIISIDIKDNFEEKCNEFKTEIIPFLEKNIFDVFNIKNIIRVGVIFSHNLESSVKIRKSLREYMNDDKFDIENISLRFSKKIISQDIKWNKKLKDYKKVHYTFLDDEDDKFIANLDYQLFFDPRVEDIRQCKIGNFLNDAINFKKDIFYKKLDQYVR